MGIIIGGPGSTGSSLLRHILNRHSKVFCGPETRILSFPKLYTNWSKNKAKIFRKGPLGIRSQAFHNITGIDASTKETYWTNSELKTLIKDSDSFNQFLDSYFGRILQKNKKVIWAEKTPNNIYSIQQFLNIFPKGQAIITLRNPLETIASQMARGKNLYMAVSHCLIHYSLSIEYLKDPRCFILYYEDLISESQETVNHLLSFLDLNYEEGLLGESDETKVHGPTQLEGWKYDETKKVAKSVSSRFDKLNKDEKDKILNCMQSLSIIKNEQLENITAVNFKMIYETLPYVTPNWDTIKDDTTLIKIRQQKKEDLLFRLNKLQLKFIKNYPIDIKSDLV